MLISQKAKILIFLKDIIRTFDQKLFDAFFFRKYGKITTNKTTKYFECNFDYKVVSYYQKNNNKIAKLCDIYGSDKGEIEKDGHPYPWPSHTYADYYSVLFSHCRLIVKKVFECGLGTNNPNILSSMGISGKPGASLRVWRDFFPNAIIYGGDIDKDCLFQEKRIKTFYVDQTNPKSIKNFWQKVGTNSFDLIIDDGLHTFNAGSTLFLNSINKLSTLGIYIIEDVSLKDLIQYREFFKDTNYIVSYINLYRPNLPLNDNSLVVIRKS